MDEESENEEYKGYTSERKKSGIGLFEFSTVPDEVLVSLDGVVRKLHVNTTQGLYMIDKKTFKIQFDKFCINAWMA